MVYLESDDEEVQRARRNPVLDILAQGDEAQRFQLMEDCLALVQRFRSIRDRLERNDAVLSLVVPAVPSSAAIRC
jgi:hypothetical protein